MMAPIVRGAFTYCFKLYVIIALMLIIPLIASIAILTIYVAVSGAPFLPTPKSAIIEALRYIKIKKGEKIYDLGAGNGKVLIIAEKYFEAEPIGFELSPIVYIIGRINLLSRRTRKSKLYFKNFFNHNISDADVVFFFLMPKTVEKLKSKLESELKKGALVISYAFEVNGWSPLKIIRKENIPPMFIYKIS